jgi:hypothetical protein
MLARKLSIGGSKIAYIYLCALGDHSSIKGGLHILKSVNGNLTYIRFIELFAGSNVSGLSDIIADPANDRLYAIGENNLGGGYSVVFSIADRENPTILGANNTWQADYPIAITADHVNELFFISSFYSYLYSYPFGVNSPTNELDTEYTGPKYFYSMITIPNLQKIYGSSADDDRVYRLDYSTDGIFSGLTYFDRTVSDFTSYHMASDESRGLVFESNLVTDNDIILNKATPLTTSYGPFVLTPNVTEPRGMAHNDTLQKLLIADRTNDSISSVNTSNLSSIVKEYDVTNATTLNGAYDIIADWDDKIAYVSLSDGNGITTVDISDLSNMSVIDSIRNYNTNMIDCQSLAVVRNNGSVVMRK